MVGPLTGAPPSSQARFRRYGTAALFLAPLAISVGVWIVYPATNTVVRSFFDRSGALHLVR